MNTQAPTTSSSTTSSPAEAHGAPVRPGLRGRLSAAAVLIGIGVGTLALRATEITPSMGAWIVLGLGLAFQVAHVATRRYELLVPAGILTGLGSGILAAQSITGTDEMTAGLVVLGLGIGFLSIWMVGGLLRVAEHHWWPLVPGGILALVGGSLVIGGQAIQVLEYWPVALVGLGVLVLVSARAGSRVRA